VLWLVSGQNHEVRRDISIQSNNYKLQSLPDDDAGLLMLFNRELMLTKGAEGVRESAAQPQWTL
jgi:hypothetical protein